MNKIQVMLLLMMVSLSKCMENEFREGSSSSSSTERTQEGYLSEILGSDLDTLSSDSPLTSPRECDENPVEKTALFPKKITDKSSLSDQDTSCICWLCCCLFCATRKNEGAQAVYKAIEK